MRTCTQCGRPGHNKRTCTTAAMRACTQCGQPGHNKRTCPARAAKPAAEEAPVAPRARKREPFDAETQEAIDWYMEMRYPGYGARQAKALAAQEEE